MGSPHLVINFVNGIAQAQSCLCILNSDESDFGSFGFCYRLLCEKHFEWNKPHSYPDWFLRIPISIAVSEIVAHTPIHILEAARYRAAVHLSMGVTMPTEIQYHLSVGLKYLLTPSPGSDKAFKDAFLEFANRIHWRIHFLLQNGDQISEYDPDYEIEHESAIAPDLPRYIERGIQNGYALVQRTLLQYNNQHPVSWITSTAGLPILSTEVEKHSLKPPFHKIHDFLLTNDLIVTGTDKNLGLAVSKREWYIQRCTDLLNNENNYKNLSTAEADLILLRQCDLMEELAYMVEELETQSLHAQGAKSLRQGRRTTFLGFMGSPKFIRNLLQCALLYHVIARLLTQQQNLSRNCSKTL